MPMSERGVPIDPKEPGHYHDGVICSHDGDCLGGTPGCKICGGQAHWEPRSLRMAQGEWGLVTGATLLNRLGHSVVVPHDLERWDQGIITWGVTCTSLMFRPQGE
jgi:hypothetical protein